MGPGYERPRAGHRASPTTNHQAGSMITTEREGFEPSVPLRVHATSNRAPSAARSSLQKHSTFLIPMQKSEGSLRPPPSRKIYSGERGIRTPGTLTGSTVFETARFNRSRISPRVMRLRGFEPPTFRSAIWRSIQLSYSLVQNRTVDPSTVRSPERGGFEPPVPLRGTTP